MTVHPYVRLFPRDTNPTINDDVSLGYEVGDVWINQSSGAIYQAVDVTDGAAVWNTGAGAAAVWGAITGTLSDQTDLQTELDGKSDIKHAHQDGPEELTNTTFDTDLSGWTAGANWAWEAGGRARHTSGSTAELTQAGTLLQNEYYKVSVTVGGRTAGSVNITLDAGDDIAISSNGTTGLRGQWVNGSGYKVRIRPSSDFDGYIDAIHITQMPYVQDLIASGNYLRASLSWVTAGNAAVRDVGTTSSDVASGDKGVTGGDSHDHDGGDGAQIAYSSLSGTLTQAAGTWNPSGVAVANVDAIVDHTAQYMRIGEVVTCSGRIEIDPTTAGVATRVRIDLPIASNFANLEDCAGSISDTAGGEGAVRADATNNEAELVFQSAVATNRSFYYIFTYRII